MESGPGRGQDQPAAEARRLLEGHGSVLHLHLRVADLADAVDDPLVRPGKPPGVERPSRVVEVVDVPGGDARRRRIGPLSHRGQLGLVVEDRVQDLLEPIRRKGDHRLQDGRDGDRNEVDPLLYRCEERMLVFWFITQPPVILKILHHIGRRFDPLKPPGRSPPLLDHFCPDPFPDYGPQ
jgi:hypothetical protein